MSCLKPKRRPVDGYKATHPSGAIINEAPNGWLDSEPKVQELIQALGLEDRLVQATQRPNDGCGKGRHSPFQCLHPSFDKPLSPFGPKSESLLEPFIEVSPPDETLADLSADDSGVI